MNLSDKIGDKLTAQTVDVLRLAEHMQATVLRDLEDLEAELIADLQKALARKATDFTLARLSALLQQTRATIATAYDGIRADTQADAERLARLVADQTAAIINSAIGVDIVTVALTPEKLTRIASDAAMFGKQPWSWWKDQDARLRDAFAREMRMGQYRGETVDQLATRVRGTAAQGFTDGIMQASRSQAQALVRTSVMTVSGETAQALYENNRDVIKGVQWVSTLDPKTCEICAALDGKQWDFPDKGNDYADYVPVGHDKEFDTPPAHWNCRCFLNPVTFSWEELADAHGNSKAAALADQVPEGTRASMDGQVASSTTFSDWLQGQSKDFQDEVLGSGKAELWRNGQIELSQLTDIRNNPLTLSQLEAKYG